MKSPALLLVPLNQVPLLFKATPYQIHPFNTQDLPPLLDKLLSQPDPGWQVFQLPETSQTQTVFFRFIENYPGNVAFQTLSTVHPGIESRMLFIHRKPSLVKRQPGKGLTGREKTCSEMLESVRSPQAFRQLLLNAPHTSFQRRILATLDQL